MSKKSRYSLPDRFADMEDEEEMHLHRSASTRVLRVRLENRPSPEPLKRIGSFLGQKPTNKRVKVEEDEKPVSKRFKVEEDEKPSKRNMNMAKSVTRHAKRADFEAARTRWLWKHRYLFTALLPSRSRSTFSDNLKRELEELESQDLVVDLEELDAQPNLVKGGEMKDYQLAGLSYLIGMYRNGMNAILGDEMGLGKTLQTLSLLAYIKENDLEADPHIVICPLSVIAAWASEAAHWVPSLKVVRFHGTQAERERLKEMIKRGHEFDLFITTYESYKAEHKWMKTRRWDYCILDEGHRVKNAQSETTMALSGLGCAFRLILTGTPVHNNLVELWALLHWLYPTIFTVATEGLFQDAFDMTHGKYDVKHLESAQKLLEVIMIRRTKDAVELSVPPRVEMTVFIPFTEAQRYWTYKLLTRLSAADMREIFNTSLKTEDGDESQVNDTQYARLMNLLIQLRMCCDHPYTILGAQPEPYELGEHIVNASSKMMVVDKLLKDVIPKGERVLIFSQWVSVLDLLEDFMQLRKYRFARLDGSTTRPRRALDIRLFQQEQSPYDVYLISTKAGGLGINLTKATHVVMFDGDWNPQNDLQAIARAHRIGQTKTVNVYRLICRGSAEDQMLDRIRRKLFLSVKLMSNGGPSADNNAAGMKKGELLSILRNGSSALEDQAAGMDFQQFKAASISDILLQSRRNQNAREAKLKKELDGENMDAGMEADVAEEEGRLLDGVAAVRCRLFEGRELTPRAIKSLAEQPPSSKKRARANRLVLVNGIETIVVSPSVITSMPPKAQKAPEFEHEEWCIYCQDGGELYTCATCPRVFHSACHGVPDDVAARSSRLQCPQHNCAVCYRSTANAGGMLFRCATCSHAFCEDCLPEGELDAIGDTIPQLAGLGYTNQSLAFYIRCNDCKVDPVIKYDEYENKYWEEEEEEEVAKKEEDEDGVVKVEDVDSDDEDIIMDSITPLKKSTGRLLLPTKLELKDRDINIKEEPMQLPTPGDEPNESALIPRGTLYGWKAGKAYGSGSNARTPVSEEREPEVIDLTPD